MLWNMNLPDLHFASPAANYQDDSKELVPSAERVEEIRSCQFLEPNDLIQIRVC